MSATTDQILEQLKSLSLLEASELVKQIEEAFGVSAAASAGVVMAAANYPATPELGQEIHGLPSDTDEAMVFHAGTVLKDGKIFTNGGRVLCVTALGDTVKQAQTHAYAVADQVHFEGMQMRRDIGFRAIRR